LTFRWAQLIRNREVSPLESWWSLPGTHPAVDGGYFTVMAEVALIDATAKTQQLAQAKDASNCHLFFGVPISVGQQQLPSDAPVVMEPQ